MRVLFKVAIVVVKSEPLYYLMEYERGEAKPLRGKTFPVKLSKEMNYAMVYERSMKKWEDYDQPFSRDRGYILVYPELIFCEVFWII